MDILIHDLNNEQFQSLFPKVYNNTHIISDSDTIRHCIGCFGCWIKTLGKCVLKDGYDNMGELLSIGAAPLDWPRFLWKIMSSLYVWYPRAKKNGVKIKNKVN